MEPAGSPSIPLALVLGSTDPLNDAFTPPQLPRPQPSALAGLLEEVRSRLPPQVMAPDAVLARRARAMKTARQRQRRKEAKARMEIARNG